MGMIAELLLGIEMSVVVEKEHHLTDHLLRELQKIPDITIYGSTDLDKCPRGGVVAFNIRGIEHGLVATYLNDFHNIAVRNGCFCAQPYGAALMKCETSPISLGSNHRLPGMVRASFGVYTTKEHLDLLVSALKELLCHQQEIKKLYAPNEDGTYFRVDGHELPRTFSVAGMVENYLGKPRLG